MAEQSYNHALAIATELGDTDAIADCLYSLTMVKLGQHQLDEAEKYHLEDVETWTERGQSDGLAIG